MQPGDECVCVCVCARVCACWQLAEAIPVAGSGLKLPLDLHTIGARCSNAYFAPRRFAAVQLAFDSPRCRVLIFHTGRLVGTGCARSLAPLVSRSCHPFSPKSLPHRLRGADGRPTLHHAGRTTACSRGQCAHPRPKFPSDQPSVSMQFEHAHGSPVVHRDVGAQVGAASIDARLDCDAFASTHSATSYYDRASFVGLAWRPPKESICCGSAPIIPSPHSGAQTLH